MLLDRKLQYQILTELSDVFPNYIDFSSKCTDEEYPKYLANVYYLELHKLITPKTVITCSGLDGNSHILSNGAITQHGLDLLADDGGITAILKTVIIKLDAQQFKELIEVKVNESNLSAEEKQDLLSSIKKLPNEAIKHLFTKIIDSGWDNLPALATQIIP